MVTFSRVPYADAVRRARRQARTIRAAIVGLAALLVTIAAIAAGILVT
jgi:hypothetical protein